MQEMFDSFDAIVELDARLRVALAHSLADLVGAACLIPIRSDGGLLYKSIIDEHRTRQHELDLTIQNHFPHLKNKSASTPQSFVDQCEAALEDLDNFQQALDQEAFDICGFQEGEQLMWALGTLDQVVLFALYKR